MDEIVMGHTPTGNEVAAILERAGRYDVIVVGTLAATPGSSQAAFVSGLIAALPVAPLDPVDLVALRTVPVP